VVVRSLQRRRQDDGARFQVTISRAGGVVAVVARRRCTRGSRNINARFVRANKTNAVPNDDRRISSSPINRCSFDCNLIRRVFYGTSGTCPRLVGGRSDPIDNGYRQWNSPLFANKCRRRPPPCPGGARVQTAVPRSHSAP